MYELGIISKIKNFNTGIINAAKVHLGDRITNNKYYFSLISIISSNKKKQKYELPENIKPIPHYIKRFYTSLEKEHLFKNRKLTISEIVNEKKHSIIIGSPGTGKTSELQYLSLEYDKLENDFNLVYKSFKNFTVTNNIIEYTGLDKYRFEKKLLLVFDGIDEISNVKDFILKLDEFINSNYEHEFQIVLSCRDNIYRNILDNKIEDFIPYYIEPLRINDVEKYLKDRYNIELDFTLLDQNLIEFIKVPFQLDIFAGYYLENSSLPVSTSQLWASYIDKRIEKDTNEKFKSEDDSRLFKINILKYNQKLAFIKELSGELIDDIKLYKLIPDEFSKKFQKSPFTFVEDKIWNFEYKIVQEYFTAKFLSELSWEKLSEIIFVDNLNRIKPNLYNTISHLFEILSGKENNNSYDNLYSHIKKNEIKLFFDIGSELFGREIRIDIFKTYYHQEYVEKELFTHYDELRKLGRFANFPQTFDYLFEILRDEKQYNENVRKNALNLMAYIDIPPSQEEAVKDSLLYLIKCNIDRLNEWSHIFTYIGKTKLKEYRDFVNEILEIYYNNISEDFGHYLSQVIFNIEDKDSYIEFIESEFSYYLGGKERRRETSIYYSNMGLDLMATMLNSENTLRILPYFLNYNSRNYLRTSAEQFFKRLEEYINTKEDFLHKVLDVYIETKAYEHEFLNYGILHSTIQDAKKVNESIDHFYEREFELTQFSGILAKWINSETLERIINVAFDKKYKKEDQLHFYNRIGFKDNDGYVIFKAIEDKVVAIEPNIKRRDAPEVLKNKDDDLKSFKQMQFNLLFDSNSIQKEANSFFDKYGLITFSNSIYYDIEKRELENQHYDHYDWQRKKHTAIHEVLHNIARYYYDSDFSFEKVLKIISKEDILYFTIREFWKTNQWINISSAQKSWLQKNTDRLAEEFLLIDNLNTNNLFFKSILYFYEKELVVVSDEFKFMIMRLFAFLESEKGLSLFGLVESRTDKKVFREQVIDNLKGNKVESESALEHHYIYCLKHNIVEVFYIIRQGLLDLKIHRYNEVSREYYKVTNDVDFLKECLQKEDLNGLALELLAEKAEFKEIVFDFCIEKLNSSEENINYDFYMELIFKMNHESAFKMLIEYIKKHMSYRHPSYTGYNNAITKYNNLEALNDLRELLEIEIKEINYSFSILKVLPSVYIGNISVNKDNYDKVRSILEPIIKEKKEEGKPISEYSYLLELSERTYVNSLNEPLIFIDAMNLVNKILH